MRIGVLQSPGRRLSILNANMKLQGSIEARYFCRETGPHTASLMEPQIIPSWLNVTAKPPHPSHPQNLGLHHSVGWVFSNGRKSTFLGRSCMMSASCPLASLTDGPLWPAATQYCPGVFSAHSSLACSPARGPWELSCRGPLQQNIASAAGAAGSPLESWASADVTPPSPPSPMGKGRVSLTG